MSATAPPVTPSAGNGAGPEVDEAVPSVPDASQRRLPFFLTRLRRPFAIAAPIATVVLIVIGEGALWEAAVAASLVFAVIAIRAAKWAWREAREAFFASYARCRGLEQSSSEDLPVVAPLLHMGDSRRAARVMTGVLPGGLEGVLAHYSYSDHRNENGREHIEPHRFTVVVQYLPDITGRLLQLYCDSRARSGPTTGVEGFRRQNRLQLESAALDRRCEIFFGPDDDEHWLHRLFTPTFIVWLAEAAPDGFAFQLENGYLCAFLRGHRESASQLDELCEAAATVGSRVIGEVRE